MFRNKSRIKVLENKIERIERQLNYIGETFIEDLCYWYRFTQDDILENRKTEMKIRVGARYLWIPRSQILIYTGAYDKEKSKIEKTIKDQYQDKYKNELLELCKETK